MNKLQASFKQAIIFVLGFASGLPLALSSSTLQAWFAVSKVDVITIGSLALVGQPYLYKFLWAPLLDKALPGPLGRRRGWILVTQIAIIIVILQMANSQPSTHPGNLALLACVLAFASATQDVAIDAYRADILLLSERGVGAAMAVMGYRMGMLLSGGIALIMADSLGWHATYIVMALAMGMALVISLFAPTPKVHEEPNSLKHAFQEPFKEFFSRPHAIHLLFLIVLFKLGEAFTSTSGSMSTTFLLQGLGFSLALVGEVNKIIGVGAVLVGVVLGGTILTRIAIYDGLIWFGLIQALANVGYVMLAYVGKSVPLLVGAVICENLAAGLGNAVIIAFLMSLCDARYSATQYAFLSAIAVAPRILLGPVAGVMVWYLGWGPFFIWTVILALPGVALAGWFKYRGEFEWLARPTIQG